MWRAGFKAVLAQDPISPGDIFGRLTTIGGPIWRFKGDIPRWVCKCECGTIKDIPRSQLLSGHINSCGCLKLDVAAALLRRRAFKHGDTAGGVTTCEFRSWASMMTRCMNPNYCKWDRYGGRGITVCERWRKYENFLADMGRRPAKYYSLDRIDNDGNYEPSNCRWATPYQQVSNKSSNVNLELDGVSMNVAQWSRKTGISVQNIRYRLRAGWPVREILTIPTMENGDWQTAGRG